MNEVPRQQAPGLNRRRIGDFTVTAVSDGYLDVSFDVLMGIDAAGAEKMLSSAGMAPLPRMNINTYVIQGGGRTILIDAGAGGFAGWGGRLQVSLAAAGVDPFSIDTILLTHAHPDHAGGLAGPCATPLFPNAELVLHETELAFWRDDANLAQAPEAFQPFFLVARNSLDAYKDNTRTFTDGEVVSGVSAHPLPGHTAGHTGFIINSGKDSLLIWGDIVHFPDIQVARPEVTIAFDSDAGQAADIRRNVLDMVSSDNILVGGMHLTAPSFIRIERAGTGYDLINEPWSPALV